MRGIKFEIPNEWGSFLSLILESIPVERYYWRLLDMDVYTENMSGVYDEARGIYVRGDSPDFIERDFYSGTELAKIINHDYYYIVFLGLIAFPFGPGHLFDNYQDFLKSNATFCIIINDSSDVFVYVKDEVTLSQLQKNAEKHHFTSVELIDEFNDYCKAWVMTRDITAD